MLLPLRAQPLLLLPLLRCLTLLYSHAAPSFKRICRYSLLELAAQLFCIYFWLDFLQAQKHQQQA
jgi:hypothetical protein